MSSTTIENTGIDLRAPKTGKEGGADKSRQQWWNPFQRSDRPRRAWLRRTRVLEDMRAEHTKLIEAIEKLHERIASQEESPSFEIDPAPVLRGIENINTGQKEISASIQSLSGHLERSQATDERLVDAVTQVDSTLAAVQGSQCETVSAIGHVTEKIDDVTKRFETLYDRMAESERTMAQDYRKLQHRTLLSVAGISGLVLVALGYFMMIQ